MAELNWGGGGGFLPPVHYGGIPDPVQNRVKKNDKSPTFSITLNVPERNFADNLP